jgi:uncharacterized protein
MILPRHPIREVGVVFATLAVATFALTRLRAVPALRDHVHLAVAVLFLVVTFRLVQREADGPHRFGVDLAGVLAPPPEEAPTGPLGLGGLATALRAAWPAALRETLVAVAVALVIFPPFALAFHLWHGPEGPFVLQWPDALPSWLLAHLVVVALPEEALFRGYFQTRLTDAWPATRRLVGVPLSLRALVAQAALFGLVHFVVDLDPQRLAVFFPALLFGWLRAWRGGIGAAIVLHALSNVYIDVLVQSWL